MMDGRAMPCANCGAPLAFDPGAGVLACPHCGAENEPPPPSPDLPRPVIQELDYAAAIADRAARADVEESQTLSCRGCGAEIGLGPETLAQDCPFCATPLSKSDAHPTRHPKVGAVLPFAIPEREARAALRRWLGSLWFAPSGLTRFAEAGRPLQGVYLPHWTYDAAGEADYAGQRGDAYYVTVRRTVMVDGKPQSRTVQERRIRWTPVSGRVFREFDDVLVPASETLGPLGQGAEDGHRRWDLSGLEPYAPRYLAGFRAEAPAVPLERGFEEARRLMRAHLMRDARFDIGGDEQRIAHLADRYGAVSFKHVLLPVWLAAYRYRNAPYRVVINARTGEIAGERPYAWWKIAVAVLLAVALAAGIAVLVAAAES